MPATASANAESPGRSAVDGPLPFLFEALAAVVIAVGGAIFTVVGAALVFGVDRAMLRSAIEAELSINTVERVTLTTAQSVDLASTVLTWTGSGLLVTGIGMLGFAALFAAFRYRSRRDPDGRSRIGDGTAVAVVGSAAAAVLSFVPGSAGLGGVVAGYFGAEQSRRPAFVGAMAGALLAIPGLLVAVFAVAGLNIGLLALGLTDSALLVVFILAIMLLVVAAINVGLGALGGYVGGLLAAD
jgi:hypothetical protein